ncbi:MAG TPA: CoA ester lyase [Solirubrobacteraceae bacterium]|nr:CoA ester lyase [Solirubrobacteraceae bacterium]
MRGPEPAGCSHAELARSRADLARCSHRQLARSSRPKLARSYLYVPADRPERIDRALAAEADAVIVDLEDAVAADRKALGRAAVRELLSRPSPKPVWVRVNAPDSPWLGDDLEAIRSVHLAGVRIPKCEDPDQIRAAVLRLAGDSPPPAVHCLLESALGVERAVEIARAHPAVCALALGEADLAADLGATADDALQWARLRILYASRAERLLPPVQSAFVELSAPDELERSCRRGRAMGFFGRAAVHSSQVPVINAAYTPTADEVRAARRALEEAQAAGAVSVSESGRMVDRAVLRSAQAVVELADRLGVSA